MADICEVCDEPLEEGQPWLGCEKCGRMFGPCCNSEQESTCIDCAID